MLVRPWTRRAVWHVRAYSSRHPIHVRNAAYEPDDWTNVTPTILQRVVGPSPLDLPNHPLSILKSLVERALPDFTSLTTDTPVVSVAQNFDELAFPADHPGRSRTDSYYLNKQTMLQTHTSAHEVSMFRTGTQKWLLTADVYRRDEIDASHYPVFHQTEGARLFPLSPTIASQLCEENAKLLENLRRENIDIEDTSSLGESNPIQSCHDPEIAKAVASNLKLTLNRLIVQLFSFYAETSEEPLKVRWIDAYFPFTSPSYEVEVLHNGKWLEILGCGVVKQSTLDTAKREGEMAWAFGLGLERICMPLFSIPDIRLFWSKDTRFLSQFRDGKITSFTPYSKFPSNTKDISFWSSRTPPHDNDVFDVVRDVAGDLVEDVRCIDRFRHPQSGKSSSCYRVQYRSMDRSLSNTEVLALQEEIQRRLVEVAGVEIR